MRALANPPLTLVAVSPPGLESLLARELSVLGLRRETHPPARPCALEFDGSEAALYRAALHLRVAERLLVRAGRFSAPSLDALAAAAARLPWRRWLPAGAPLDVRAECRGSKVRHEGAAAERIARAAGAVLSKDGPRLEARIERDVCTLELDASGEPLHRRGWRLETAKAPLRETLASALVLASAWDRSSPLVDPFCGAGTIAIEAALLARRVPPGASRRFGFMDWPSFDAALWEREKAQKGKAGSAPRILASDRDEGAVRAARANAGRAGVEGAIEFRVAAFSAAELPEGPGWLVSNPPYGERVDGGDPRDLYAALGALLRERARGWRAALIAPPALARGTGLRFGKGLSTLNGGLEVSILAAGPI